MLTLSLLDNFDKAALAFVYAEAQSPSPLDAEADGELLVDVADDARVLVDDAGSVVREDVDDAVDPEDDPAVEDVAGPLG